MSQTPDLMGLLEDLTVEQLDDKLSRMTREWRRYYTIRMMLAAEQGISTPPPEPPAVGGPKIVEAKSTLTWAALIDRFKTDERSPYQKLKFATRSNYDGLLRRLDDEIGGKLLSLVEASHVEALYDGWKVNGTVSMARALTVMCRTLINFGSKVLQDPECHRLAVQYHRMRQLTEHPTSQNPELTEEHVRAIIKQAHAMGFPSIGFAQALQFECKLGQKDVVGEWVPLTEPGESAIEKDDTKWLRGLRWCNIDRNLILTHLAGRALKPFIFDLRNAPMVLDEIERVKVRDPIAPLIISENTKFPYRTVHFRRTWRHVADAAGIPSNVKNRDSRMSRDDDDSGDE
jgi:hypothetical protein